MTTTCRASTAGTSYTERITTMPAPRTRTPRRGSIALDAAHVILNASVTLAPDQATTFAAVVEALMQGGHTLTGSDIAQLVAAVTDPRGYCDSHK